ncbi:MAG: SCO family protein [Ramlibacter sp.]
MNHPTFNRREALLSLGALACAPLAAGAAPSNTTPGNSVYQLHAALTDQDGHAFDLESLRGTPVLVSMFYSSCQMVCPMVFETIHSTLKALPADERSEVKVVMISFDPARDTVAVLKKTAAVRNCDAQWTLARGDENTSRKIAAALNIQYRRLSDGEFNHSTIISLLDREGRIAARTGKLGTVDTALVKAVHEAHLAKG